MLGSFIDSKRKLIFGDKTENKTLGLYWYFSNFSGVILEKYSNSLKKVFEEINIVIY